MQVYRIVVVMQHISPHVSVTATCTYVVVLGAKDCVGEPANFPHLPWSSIPPYHLEDTRCAEDPNNALSMCDYAYDVLHLLTLGA